ncbi:two-component system sensor histidine kinase YesM [Anaerotaenia torta]|uniref:sensor histidine kinase n=1 Tax=Anaerotaenia torta TaxID=433293 RepID=UPI003D25E88E
MKHRFLSFDSIFFRLFLTFLIIMIPFEATGLILFTWTKNTIQREIEDTSALKVHYLKEHLETEIYELSSQLERLSNMNLFSQFSLNNSSYSAAEYYISLLDQYDLIKHYPTNYGLVTNVTIYYQNLSKSLTAGKGLIPTDNSHFDALTTILKDTYHPLKRHNNQLILGTMYPVNTQFTNSEPFYIITMSLSEGYILDYLSSSNIDYDTIVYDHTYHNPIHASSIIPKNNPYEAYYPLLEQKLLSDSSNSTTTSFKKDSYYIIAEYSPYLNCSFVQFIPIDKLLYLPRKMSGYLFVFTLLSIIGIAAYTITSVILVNRPISTILGGYHSIQSGNYDIELPSMRTSKEFDYLIRGFNKMAAQLSLSIDQVYKYEIYSKKMELKQLQMQINPHFLYNTYFILHRMIGNEDLESAKELSAHMGNYFQYITRNKNDMETLEKEWAHTVNYLEIQAIRYSMRIKIEIKPLPEEYRMLEVPRLILQPLLENALEHGLNQKLEQGIVTLSCTAKNTLLIIEVSDNGEAVNEEMIAQLERILDSPISPEQETTALVNIHKRLRLVYGDMGGISFEKNLPSGLIVRLNIPLEVTPSNRNKMI